MFPFQKIFTMLIRTFSRPMLGYIKRKQHEQGGSKFANLFIGFGRRVYIVQHWMSLRIMKTTHKKNLVQLKQEILLEKGIETFYEILFYLIVLGLPFWQLFKSSIAAQKKQQRLQKRISNIEKKMDHINQKINKIVDFAKEKGKEDKAKAKKKAQEYEKILQLEDRKSINTKMNLLGEATSDQEESIAEKIEEMFENAIEVMADQFQDSLDEMEFPVSSSQANITDPDTADSELQSIDVDGDTGSSDLLEQNIDIDTDSPQITLDAPQIDISDSLDPST